MSNAGALNLADKRSLTSALMVMLRPEGLMIPGLDTIHSQPKHTPIPLGLPELLLLSELQDHDRPLSEAVERVANQIGTKSERLHEVIEKLWVRGLLIGSAQLRASEAVPEQIRADDGESALLDRSALLSMATPRLFRLSRGRFEHLDHEGQIRVELSAVELVAASEFRQSITVPEALHSHRRSWGRLALDESGFNNLVHRLSLAELLERTEATLLPEPEHAPLSRQRTIERNRQRMEALKASMQERVRACESAEREHEKRTGHKRVRVVVVQHNGTIFPLALGLIVAAAKSYDGGRLNEHYVFHPDWLMDPSKVEALGPDPGVYLFSNYDWSHRQNLRVSKKVKELTPWSVTIHGGPNTPKYEEDCKAYFHANPDVDITVRGEGESVVAELLAALIGAVGNGAPDLSVLRGVAGIAFRDGDQIVSTPERERIADIDSIPSPILTGLFDAYEETDLGIIETNRGCPYSCTFCDWGSATTTKVRKFSLERVFKELEWCARNRVAGIFCADANFGMYERDVEIAEKVVALKKEYGYPNAFSTSFAKNTSKYTKRIIETFVRAGIISRGNIAVQTLDTGTLAAIRRSNIKLDKYDELAADFRKAGLPLWVDLMFALPGQTVASFQNDLQECINRDMFPRIFTTELLVNSPMNEPGYRQEHRIEAELAADGRNLVVSTATFTRQEYEEMNVLRNAFLLFDVVGMLRHVARYVRSETGVREIDFYERLRRDICDDPERWPTLAFSIRALPGVLVPPTSWHLIMQEARRYLCEVIGIETDNALTTVLAVQHAVLPSRGRRMPQTLDLPHDYASWHHATVEAVQAGNHDDWERKVPKLREFGPGTLTIDDPDHLCDFGIGAAVDGDIHGNYELRSLVARCARPDAADTSALSSDVSRPTPEATSGTRTNGRHAGNLLALPIAADETEDGQ